MVKLLINRKVTNVYISRSVLESTTIEGDSPVYENISTFQRYS